MKPQPRKSHIVIPDLIRKMRPKDSDKQNLSTHNLPSHPSSHPCTYSKSAQKPLPAATSALQQPLPQSPFDSTNLKNSHLDELEPNTTENTDRGLQLCEQSSIRSAVVQGRRHGGELGRLEGLLRSEKMFVNPDKWSEFVERAVGDEQFQKALNVFMYTYFIQHYN